MISSGSIFSALLCSLTVTSALPIAENATIQGFTREGIAAMNAAIHSWVDEKKGANVVTLLARGGEIVDHDAYGVLDFSAEVKTPVKKDTIFRIASMTKPVIGVAMMMFQEEGKWQLDDPVSKHIPEFADLRVKLANGFPAPQNSPMVMAQLMSHSAGFPGQLSVPSPTLGGILPPLLKNQLAFQPGTDWRYGPGVEIQGYLLEKWSGLDISDFLQERLFGPMGMVDTGFFLNASKVDRVTKVHQALTGPLSTITSRVSTTKPPRLSPSGGLYSTAENYWRFCQMISNGGEFNGRRYLKAETVKTMHTNVLEPGVKVKFGTSNGIGIGFGMDFAIVLDQAASSNNMPKDSYYWGGAYGTWFWIDPTNDVIFIGMIQNQGAQLSGDSSLRQISAKGAYAALKR